MRSVRQLFRVRVVVAAVLAFGGLVSSGSASAAFTTTVSITSRLEPAIVGRGSPSPAVVAPAAKGAVAAPAEAAPTPPVSGPAGDPGPASAAVAVAIVDLEFSPARVRVAAGGEVTWTNGGAAPHTATARDQSFDSGILAPQGTFSRRFDAPGAYDYICLVHPDMVGVVEVGTVIAGVIEDAPVMEQESNQSSR